MKRDALVSYVNILWIFAILMCYAIKLSTREQVKESFAQIKSSCDFPVTYKIGTIDPRFKITVGELRQAITHGEKLWEDGVGRNLFSFDEEADLTINLVYDERQSLIDKIKGVELNLSNNRTKTLVPQLDGFIEDLLNLTRLYNQKVFEHERRLKHFLVDGLTDDEVRFIETQEQELDRISGMIRENSIFLKETYPYIVGEAEKYDALLTSYRLLLNSHEGRHVAGVYRPSRRRVEIYMFWTEDDLASTVAHELGHAIGLNHTETPDALMNKIVGESITTADLRLFASTCH